MLTADRSSRLPRVFIHDKREQLKMHVHVIRSFLNYLLHHDVCPEYRDQLFAARRTCDAGEDQLWRLRQSSLVLPGDFNHACSVIWGGQYFDSYVGDDAEWVEKLKIAPGMKPEHALKIFTAAFSNHGTDAQVAKYSAQKARKETKVVREFQTFFEVTGIQFATDEVKQVYEMAVLAGVRPVGKMTARTWHCPADPDEDLTEEEEAELKRNGRPVETFEFWLEDSVLETLFEGMRIQAQVYELSFGVYYFDTVTASVCAFYEFVPNEDMIGWREHRYLPPRPTLMDDCEEPGEGEKEGEEGEEEGDDVEKLLEGYEKGEDINIEV